MVKNKPNDQKLYNRIKASVYKANPKHSAYRSGQIVKQYKAAFKKNMEVNHLILVIKQKEI